MLPFVSLCFLGAPDRICSPLKTFVGAAVELPSQEMDYVVLSTRTPAFFNAASIERSAPTLVTSAAQS